ncbi:MAG: outer membrane protein assembly factor BamA [Syntrophales bacterium]|nr:outer membrane protein assembly factor BamA [Syntrophales bacterium]MDY0044526.1 outer membrane protein assembly factor BamA [Syntrophales bacterium]
MTVNRRAKYLVMAFFAFFLLFPRISLASEAKRIAVFPFTVHSKSDVTYLKENIAKGIVSELQKRGGVEIVVSHAFQDLTGPGPVNESEAVSAAEKTDADFVVMGSLTRLGSLISVDVQIVDIERGLALQNIYAQGTGIESLESISKTLADKIAARLLVHQRIADVIFKGNRRVEESALYNTIKSTRGSMFSSKVLSEDIKSIFKMEYFKDVKTRVEDSPGGKIITFTLEEQPLIKNIDIIGNDKIDRDDIEEVITIKPRQIFNPGKAKSDAEEIKNFYKGKGYLNAEVTYATEGEGGNDISVVFKIVEHRRPYIKEISFKGNRVFTDKELKDMMEVSEWGIFHFLTDSGLLNRSELKKDIEKLTAFYHNNGYINAQIGEPEITTDEKWIYIEIPVIEGKQFKVGQVTITGDTLSVSRPELAKNLEIVKKDYFDREAIVKDMDYLIGAANNEGYAYASVYPHTEANEQKQEVDVTYKLEKGNLVYINRISITGNDRTRDKVIRRTLSLVEGELYNRDKLKRSYNSLNQLRYFEEVNFQTGKGSEESRMDINVHVKEKPTGLFSIGAGYSAQENAIFVAQITERNLFGRGQSLSLETHLGSSTTDYELSFIEPWLFDIPLWSKVEAWDTKRDEDAYDVDTQGLGLTLGYNIFERVMGYVRYEFSINNVTDISPSASRFVKEQEGEITSSGITLNLTRDTKNDWIFPSGGSKNSVSVEFTGSFLQGDASFTRYRAESRWYFQLPFDNVFAIGGQAGLIQGNEGKEVPIYERFYLGGINTLRGLRDVGPKDPLTGDVIGGESMFVLNTELVFPLMKDAGIRGVVFFDIGNAWESGYHFDDTRETAGIGIRWHSPIGPFRLEWGHVLDKKEGESSNRWEFTIGMTM